jgi:hypothetical protein
MMWISSWYLTPPWTREKMSTAALLALGLI